MRLSEIQIERCGVWRDLTLPLNPSGLNVLYGPNEAGKSTLVHFIRGVLYGFTPVAGSGADSAWYSTSSGSLVVEAGAGPQRVHRVAPAEKRGAACLIDADRARPADEFLTHALAGIDESLFRAVYAIDLRELQELGTLTGDEAAKRIYGLSLGPDGRRLLDANHRAQAARNRLVDPIQHDGELVRLIERQDQLAAQLAALDRQRQQHSDWCHRREQIEHDIADLRRRQAGLQEQLRGHLFLERAWGPWHHLREWRRELAERPVISGFPDRGLERLERVEQAIAAASENFERHAAELKQLRLEMRTSAADGAGLGNAAAMRRFVEQRGWLAELDRQRTESRGAAETAEQAFDASLESLGVDWSSERMSEVDLSPAGWQRVSGAVQSLRTAQVRQGLLKRKCRRLNAGFRELRDSLAECLHDLQGRSIETALTEARERLRQVHHLGRLQLREAELNQRQYGLSEDRQRIAPQLTLPRWVYIVLGVFCFMGIVLAGWGLIAGVATSGIAGAIYAMLGITCAGLAWGLKTQYEGDARQRMDENETRLAATLVDLHEVRESIRTVTGETARAPAADGASNEATPDSGDLVRQAAERVAELVELTRHQRTLRALRRRLTDTRQKLETARRETTTAHDAWSNLLADLGFPAELPVDQVLDTWQKLVVASDRRQHAERARAEAQAVDRLWDGYRQRIADFGRRLGSVDFDHDRPLEVLSAWEGRLAELSRLRHHRRALKKRRRALRRDVVANQARVARLNVQRNALLVQAGAASHVEFVERAGHVARRAYLDDQCAGAQRDLDATSAEHTELALVEEDLLSYEAQSNSDSIDILRLESADVEQDLHQAFERLGAVKTEIQAIEGDRQASSLRLDLEQVHHQLQQAAREWAVLETAAQVGDDVRRDYERRHQPAALVAASSFISRLTDGRFATVWTPLGERRLMVDDDRGRSLPVSALSQGTREQLFLSVRLAVIAELLRHGMALPVLLDDVFVNFDDRRAAAAAELLRDFAAEGHQVLFFTCHLHLAQIFRERGIEPSWLPSLRPPDLAEFALAPSLDWRAVLRR